MFRRHFRVHSSPSSQQKGKEGGSGSTWLVSRAASVKSETTGKDTKLDSELKAKVEATVSSPAGADEQFYDRNFVTAVRAMSDFLLRPEHLVGI